MSAGKHFAAAWHFNLVAGIWASDSNQQVVLTAQIGSNLAFAFATVLAAHQNIDQSEVLAPVPTEMARDTNHNILFIASIAADNHVCVISQSLDRCFRFVREDIFVGFQFRYVSALLSPFNVATFQFLQIGGQMDVHDLTTVCFAQEFDLAWMPNGIDDN